LQGADGGVDRSQLALDAVAPEDQHLQFALLMPAAVLACLLGITAGKEGRDHGQWRSADVLAIGTRWPRVTMDSRSG